MKKIIIYTDGGARGNPGPAGIGMVIGNKEYSQYIGKTTNNVAEYRAVIEALKIARKELGEETKNTAIELRLDSQLVERQLNGLYKVKDKDLKELYLEVLDLVKEFEEVRFVHILREKNREADRLVNKVLDANINT